MNASFIGFIGLILLSSALPAATAEVGEWGIDAEMCAESRVVFTADGLHQAQMLQDGQWQALASAPYRRDGNILIVEADGAEERLEVLEESAGRLVLRNADEARQEALGIDRLELERCPDA